MTCFSPSPSSLFALFADAMQHAAPFEDEPYLAVAVSGGSDSLALLHLAQQWCELHRGQLTALIVDHGLRTESQEEALQTAAYCRSIGIETVILTWHGSKPNQNIQALARRARYELMTRWCHTHGVLHLLTGHQQDDLLETFLMGNGNDTDSACRIPAIPIMASQQGIRIIRPLYQIPREDLRRWLGDMQVRWIDDPSNQSTKYQRVKLRKEQEASLATPNLRDQMLTSLKSIITEHQAYSSHLAKAGAGSISFPVPGTIRLNLSSFFALAHNIQIQLLHRIICCLGAGTKRLRMEKVRRLHDYIFCHASDAIHTQLHHVVVRRYLSSAHRDYLYFMPAPPALAALPLVSDPAGWFGTYGSLTLHFQSAHTDPKAFTIAPLGKAGWKQVKAHLLHYQRVLLPESMYFTLPAVFALEKPVWVPYLSYKDTAFIDKDKWDYVSSEPLLLPPLYWGVDNDVFFSI